MCCAELQGPLHQHASTEWAFVTACKPRSQRLSDDENRQRQVRLKATLDALGLATYPGVAVDPRGEWPPEPSFLVIGIDHPTAISLAQQFEQNAIVAGRSGEPAELVDCRSGQ